MKIEDDLSCRNVSIVKLRYLALELEVGLVEMHERKCVLCIMIFISV